MNDDMIQNLVNERKRLSVQEMSVVLIVSIPPSTVHRHLKKMGMVSKLEIWVTSIH